MDVSSHELDLMVALRQELTNGISDIAGLGEHQAANLADAITALLQERYGGQEVYIRARSRQERDRAVMADFDGTNRDEVCRKHDISKATLYRILARG